MSETAEKQRREAYYSGRVQGVGFRYTVRSLAARFEVAGFVKNLPDGRVELVAEGPAAEVREFLETIHTEMGHYVADVAEKITMASGEFQGFEIRF